MREYLVLNILCHALDVKRAEQRVRGLVLAAWYLCWHLAEQSSQMGWLYEYHCAIRINWYDLIIFWWLVVRQIVPRAAQLIWAKRWLLQQIYSLFHEIGLKELNELDRKQRALYSLIRFPEISKITFQNIHHLVDFTALNHLLNFVPQCNLVSLMLQTLLIGRIN